MLPDLPTAIFLALCLAVFASVSLYNLRKFDGTKKKMQYKAEVETPRGLFLAWQRFGTGIFFLETVVYVFLVFTGLETVVRDSLFQLRFSLDSWVQLVGISIIAWLCTVHLECSGERQICHFLGDA